MLGAPPSSNIETDDQFGVSLTLFTTMAAVNAAGYDEGLNSPIEQQYPIRKQIREEIAKKSIPCLPELRAFYQQHKKQDEAANLGQYVSFSMLAAGPPLFELPMGELPPDVEPLKGLSPLLVRFYREANIEELWKKSQRAYAASVARIQEPIIQAIFEANGYARNESGYKGRRFQIFVDLQGEPNQVQVRNYKGNYYVVVTPNSVPIARELRDAYLSYLLDPLTFRYKPLIEEKKDVEKIAQRAPALRPEYKQDFSLLLTKSLVKAIDARLIHGDPDGREEAINNAMREGYILTRAFADLLPSYEKQEENLSSYYPDLVNAVDVRKVERSLKDFQFAQSAPSQVITSASAEQASPAEQTFESAEGRYEQGQYDDAARLYKRVFEQTDNKQLHGRSYYRLGLIAIRNNRKDEAVQMFERAVENNPDPATTGWSHVYLARLAQAAGDADRAKQQFKLAAAIEGATPKAKEAAESGLQKLSSGEKQQ